MFPHTEESHSIDVRFHVQKLFRKQRHLQIEEKNKVLDFSNLFSTLIYLILQRRIVMKQL